MYVGQLKDLELTVGVDVPLAVVVVFELGKLFVVLYRGKGLRLFDGGIKTDNRYKRRDEHKRNDYAQQPEKELSDPVLFGLLNLGDFGAVFGFFFCFTHFRIPLI